MLHPSSERSVLANMNWWSLFKSGSNCLQDQAADPVAFELLKLDMTKMTQGGLQSCCMWSAESDSTQCVLGKNSKQSVPTGVINTGKTSLQASRLRGVCRKKTLRQSNPFTDHRKQGLGDMQGLAEPKLKRGKSTGVCPSGRNSSGPRQFWRWKEGCTGLLSASWRV